tara:strand:+ start:387 stop:770 length:384 start_codon:yes stop_codon:yes gene_type:complete
MAEVLSDEGYLLWMPQVERPTVPYWTNLMAMAKFTDLVIQDTEESGNLMFISDDGELLGVQMKDPVDESGAPIESVIDFLKGSLDDEMVDEFLQQVITTKTDIGEVDRTQLEELERMLGDTHADTEE